MGQNQILVDVLQQNLGLVQMTVADMTDAELVQRPVPKANNGLWQLGHLAASDARMVNGCAAKTVIELPAGFAEKYTKQNVSIDDPAKLGAKADLLTQLENVRGKMCQWISTLTPADLAKPTPEQIRNRFPTVAHLLTFIPGHTAMHMGQIQVLRRKLGKPILF
jgi:uncharacterized damage-inducible protein DinB